MTRFRAALLAASLVCGMSSPGFAQSVGVTAAVNQSAKGTQPNSAVRTIAIGDSVIYNERVETDARGLVQILLADGTTFTVGPNSALVIDSFVYNPEANTAQVAATLTKGVFRFIGGATSKTEDGVALKTPVGTVGIRGGVTDINLSPKPGTPIHIDMIFGNEVTLQNGGEMLGRLYQAGYSLALGTDGSIGVQKTPAAWSSDIQSAFAGSPGSNGGAANPPSDGEVAQSGVPDANSSQSLADNTPPLLAPPPPTADEIETLLLAAATYAQTRDYLVDHVHQPPGEPTTRQGFAAGMVQVSGDFTDIGFINGFAPLWTTSGGTDLNPKYATVTLDQDGRPVAAVFDVSAGCSGACGLLYSATGTTGTGTIYGGGPTLPFPASGELRAHNDAVLPAGVDYCSCAFLDWGLWSTQASVHVTPFTLDIGIDRGAWVVGDLTSADQLADLSTTTATFDGHAIGTAVDHVFDGQSALVAGDMAMQWSFATRQGTIDITDFDGRDFSGALAMPDGSQTFAGTLGGDGFGRTQGGFVNDGSVLAQGVIGDFTVTDGDWAGVGVFMGQR